MMRNCRQRCVCCKGWDGLRRSSLRLDAAECLEPIRYTAIDAGVAGCELTNVEMRTVLEKSIGVDCLVGEASWVDVVCSILVGEGTGGVGVEGVPAGLHLDDSGRRPVSFKIGELLLK